MSNINTQKWLLNRRHVLRGIGASIALPLLNCMRPSRASAEKVVDLATGIGPNPLVDARGMLPDGRSFSGAPEFQQLLLEDIEKFNATFVKKLATFALRRTMTVDDRDDLASIAEESKARDYRLRDIIEAIVLSDLFQKR